MAVSIRNLTAQALTLKLVERHETPPLKISDPNSKDSNGNGSHSFAQSVSNFTHNVTDFFSGHSKDDASAGRRPSRVALSEKAEAFQRDEANLRIEPFTTVRTTVNTTELGKGQMVRLNFQGDGPARWRFDIPPTTNASQEFTPLTQNPPFAYTGVFIDTSNLLTIFETTDLKAWMKKIADETPLGALSLPGTHNSATHYKALPSVRCQSVPVKEQLENGVRFLDIRVQPTHTEDNHSDELNIVHGVFPITLTGQKKFRPMLKDVLNFLRENPTETVIMSIKREGSGDATDSDLAKRLHGHYTNNEEWFTEPRVPTLGEVRGRIVLVRRFALAEALKSEWRGKGWAINANNWPYNTPMLLMEMFACKTSARWKRRRAFKRRYNIAMSTLNVRQILRPRSLPKARRTSSSRMVLFTSISLPPATSGRSVAGLSVLPPRSIRRSQRSFVNTIKPQVTKASLQTPRARKPPVQ